MNTEDEKNINNKLIRPMKIVLAIIVVLMLLMYLLLIIETTLLGNKTPSIFGKKYFIIVSNSMEPEINVGDVAVFKQSNSVNVGDIIAFKRKNTVIVHRIVNKTNINGIEMYQTKGDKNNAPDIGFTSMDNIEGVLVDRVPFIGKVFIWIYNNLFIIVFIMAALIIARYFVKKKNLNKQ